ncbi:Ribonuclease H-like superfamily [Sesbania bispinosa]|nr:Ribonuclease H-like superfamily [Sesbania bispinosa]
MHGANLSCNSALEVELWGLLKGAQLSKCKGFSNIIFESVSIVAIKLINEGCSETHLCLALVTQIQETGKCFELACWVYAPHEANSLVDSFAKVGMETGLDTENLSAPFFCPSPLLFDGVASLL